MRIRRYPLRISNGGKRARAAVVTSREKLIQKMRQYSIYVDVKANGDRELIVGAGLADDLVTPASTPVTKDPTIRKLFRPGASGQIGVFTKAMTGSSGAYQLQCGECKDVFRKFGEKRFRCRT